MMPSGRQPREAGFTLLELVLAMALSALVLAGTVGALVITARAAQPGGADNATAGRGLVAGAAALEVLSSDLRLATAVADRGAARITLTVPRHDGTTRQVSYAWNGSAGSPLTREDLSGEGVQVLAADVRRFVMTFATAAALDSSLAPATAVVAVTVELQVGPSTAHTARTTVRLLGGPLE